MDFRPATEADADAWQAFLAATPSGDFLHDWAWADVAAFDGQPQRRYLVEEDGAVVAIAAAQERPVLGGRAFWYVPHGPILDWGSPTAGERLRAMVIGLRLAAARHRAIAVKLEPRLEAGAPELDAFRGRGLRPTTETLQVGQTRIVELADDEALLAGFDKDTRYAVRRAEREGVARRDHRGRRGRGRHRRAPRPRRRDAAPRRLPDAAARALSGGVARAGRRRAGRHPRGAA